MSDYDRRNVDTFIQNVERVKDPELLGFLTVVARRGHEPESNEGVYANRIVVDFFSLGTWEQANVLYGLRDRIDTMLVKLAKDKVNQARREDDQTDPYES